RADTGQEKVIDLSQPVNYLRLSAVELTAVFNHPPINKNGKLTESATGQQEPPDSHSLEVFSMNNLTNTAIKSSKRDVDQPPSAVAARSAETTNEVTIPITQKFPPAQTVSLVATTTAEPKNTNSSVAQTGEEVDPEPMVERAAEKIETPESLPNQWLKPLLVQPPIRFDWLSNLVYDKVAEHFGNSHQGQLGPMSCWAVSLSETQ